MKLSICGVLQWELLQAVWQLFRMRQHLDHHKQPNDANLGYGHQYDNCNLPDDIEVFNQSRFFNVDFGLILYRIERLLNTELPEASVQICLDSLKNLVQDFENLIDDGILRYLETSLLPDISSNLHSHLPTSQNRSRTSTDEPSTQKRKRNYMYQVKSFFGRSVSKPKRPIAPISPSIVPLPPPADPSTQARSDVNATSTTLGSHAIQSPLFKVCLDTSQPYTKLRIVQEIFKVQSPHDYEIIKYLDAFIQLRKAQDYAKISESLNRFDARMREFTTYSLAFDNDHHAELTMQTKTPSEKALSDADSDFIDLTRNLIESFHGGLAASLPDCPSGNIGHQAKLYLPLKKRVKLSNASFGIGIDMYFSTCLDPILWNSTQCLLQSSPEPALQSGSAIQNLCPRIKESRGRRHALRLLSMRESLHDISHAHERIRNISRVPSVSLRSLLNKGHFFTGGGKNTSKVSLKDKRALAVILAHIMLQLCGGPWIQDAWDANKIYFLFDPSSQKVLNLRQPYIATSFNPSEPVSASGFKNSPTLSARSLHKPMVLDFARLLLELETGKTLTPSEEDLDTETKEETQDTQLFMLDRILRELSDNMYVSYRSAIEACLDCDGFPLARPPSFEHPEFRKLIYNKVIVPLEEELFTGFKLKAKDLDTGIHSNQDTGGNSNQGPDQCPSIQITTLEDTLVSAPAKLQGELFENAQDIPDVPMAVSEVASSYTDISSNGDRVAVLHTSIRSISTTSGSPSLYKIAIICPMGIELAPVIAMLDTEHPRISFPIERNRYILGRICGRDVVVTVMPEIGTNSAASVVTQLTNDFPSLQFGLLVGIGGAIPDPDGNDIRLGDIVVSKPATTFGGVVQFDRGKRNPDENFERTGHLNKPPPFISASLEELIARHKIRPNNITHHLAEMIRLNDNMAGERYVYQGEENDILFQHDYRHNSKESDCTNCLRDKIVKRRQRTSTAPEVHYGTIGSANIVLKDGETREKLKKEFGIIGVEMEAAGINQVLPCLIIRGICDYADSHKAKRWQPYAAATAAAFAKEFLSFI